MVSILGILLAKMSKSSRPELERLCAFMVIMVKTDNEGDNPHFIGNVIIEYILVFGNAFEREVSRS